MPLNKGSFPLTARYIELIHDRGIGLVFPGIEPVASNDCLDRNLLESAAVQPFQSGFGVDFYPTVYEKAACLFFSIAGGHIFGNGNKRTAVIALDHFLLANAIYLHLSNDQIHDLAIATASYRTRNEDQQAVKASIAKLLEENCAEFRVLHKKHRKEWAYSHKFKRAIRKANQPTATES